MAIYDFKTSLTFGIKVNVLKTNNNTWRKCHGCGKYLSYDQIEKQTNIKQVFIPDTDFGPEESYFIHNSCI